MVLPYLVLAVVSLFLWVHFCQYLLMSLSKDKTITQLDKLHLKLFFIEV